jgi:hypothetical protein
MNSLKANWRFSEVCPRRFAKGDYRFKEHPRMDWFYLGIVLLCFAATWGFMHLVDRV